MQVAASFNQLWVEKQCSWPASHSFSLEGRVDNPWVSSRHRKARSPPSVSYLKPCPPQPRCHLSSRLQSREVPARLRWLLIVSEMGGGGTFIGFFLFVFFFFLVSLAWKKSEYAVISVTLPVNTTTFNVPDIISRSQQCGNIWNRRLHFSIHSYAVIFRLC